MAGHPRHQVRQFTVTVRRGTSRAQVVRVMAQTERDAVLRAGLTLGGRAPHDGPGEWIVTAVRDPAPFIWTPPPAT